MINLKQIIAVTLTATAVAATAIVSASALDTQKYDLNDDGRFDVQDVTYLQIKIAGDGELTDNQKKIADYNNDGKIDVQDVTSALFSHQRPDGTSWSMVLKQNNVSYTSAAENIAAGQNTPEAVVKEWMNSPSHRANIMNSKYNKIGVSCYVDQNAPYRYYWEQLFIKG